MTEEEAGRIQVRLCGTSNTPCGYCGGERAKLVGRGADDSSKSYGLLVSSISCSDYEMLLSQGWRRSGLHLYKPDNWQSCCPALTIRLPVNDFTSTKSQKRVLRKMTKALEGPVTLMLEKKKKRKTSKKRKRQLNPSQEYVMSSSLLTMLKHWTSKALADIVKVKEPQEVTFKIMQTKDKHIVTLMTPICAAIAGKAKGLWKRDVLSVQVAEHLHAKLKNTTPNGSKITISEVKAHSESGQVLVLVRPMEEPQACTKQDDTEMEVEVLQQDSIEEWLHQNGSSHCLPRNAPHQLTVSTLPAHVSALQPEVHKLYFLYQQRVHDDPDPTKEEQGNDSEDEDDDFGRTEWKEEAETMLRQEYTHLTESQFQAMKVSFTSFYRFLAESPLNESNHHLIQSSHNLTGKPQGTLHQQYRVDGRLVAVGVVDILPTGLSSVYAFYDPVFAHKICPLGKFMIMKEIEFCRDTLHLPYYYLGYYIESCDKMRYKAEYHPSQLLCPKHHEWVNAEDAQKILARESPTRNCCVLYEGNTALSSSSTNHFTNALNRIPLVVGAPTLVTLPMLHMSGQDIVRPLLERFVQEVGIEIALRSTIRLV